MMISRTQLPNAGAQFKNALAINHGKVREDFIFLQLVHAFSIIAQHHRLHTGFVLRPESLHDMSHGCRFYPPMTQLLVNVITFETNQFNSPRAIRWQLSYLVSAPVNSRKLGVSTSELFFEFCRE